MSLCSKNRFASSANIIVFDKLEALGRLCTYIKDNSDPKDRSLCYSTCYFLFISLGVFINASILFSMCQVASKPGNICTRNSIESIIFKSIVSSTVLNAFGKSTKVPTVYLPFSDDSQIHLQAEQYHILQSGLF